MINNDAFAERLKSVMSYYGLSAASFAEKIQVQRSSISHILSGRNKPSLDFVMKVVSAFEEVELYWLLNGKGNFPHSTPPPRQESAQANPTPAAQTNTAVAAQDEERTMGGHKNAIERIVIFYSDGTFDDYLP